MAETAQEKVASLESIRNQMALELARSRRLLMQAQQESAALLAACALLVGALGPLRWRLAALCTQKARLLELLAGHEAFEREVASLVWALEPKDMAPPGEQAGRGLRAFRRGAVVALAANRLRRLGEHSRLLFISDCGPAVLPALPVCALGARTPADCASEYHSEGPVRVRGPRACPDEAVLYVSLRFCLGGAEFQHGLWGSPRRGPAAHGPQGNGRAAAEGPRHR